MIISLLSTNDQYVERNTTCMYVLCSQGGERNTTLPNLENSRAIVFHSLDFSILENQKNSRNSTSLQITNYQGNFKKHSYDFSSDFSVFEILQKSVDFKKQKLVNLSIQICSCFFNTVSYNSYQVYLELELRSSINIEKNIENKKFEKINKCHFTLCID